MEQRSLTTKELKESKLVVVQVFDDVRLFFMNEGWNDYNLQYMAIYRCSVNDLILDPVYCGDKLKQSSAVVKRYFKRFGMKPSEVW